jgi:hypothetical protein
MACCASTSSILTVREWIYDLYKFIKEFWKKFYFIKKFETSYGLYEFAWNFQVKS